MSQKDLLALNCSSGTAIFLSERDIRFCPAFPPVFSLQTCLFGTYFRPAVFNLFRLNALLVWLKAPLCSFCELNSTLFQKLIYLFLWLSPSRGGRQWRVKPCKNESEHVLIPSHLITLVQGSYGTLVENHHSRKMVLGYQKPSSLNPCSLVNFYELFVLGEILNFFNKKSFHFFHFLSHFLKIGKIGRKR